MAKCFACGGETETPWQCLCGFSRLPTQQETDDLIRRLLLRREEWREERRRVIERERRHQEAERFRAEHRRQRAEVERLQAEWRRYQEAQKAAKAAPPPKPKPQGPPPKPKPQGPVVPPWLSQIFAHPPTVWAPEPEKVVSVITPEPENPKLNWEEEAIFPMTPRQYKRYRRGLRRAVLQEGLGAESRFLAQRNEAAHQYFLRLADQVAESLPERGPGEIWWD